MFVSFSHPLTIHNSVVLSAMERSVVSINGNIFVTALQSKEAIYNISVVIK